MIWLTLAGVLFGLLLSGAWIGVALGITGIVIMEVWGPGVHLLASAIWSSLDIYGLTSIPVFLFMGQIILNGGLSGRIYDAVSPLLARLPGKLLHSNIVVSGLFAAVFGSSTACAAAVGSIAIPELRRRKYDNKLILGSICMAGTLGLMIPPSGQFILYGAIVDVSVGALFAAGMTPGIMMILLFMIYIFIKGVITPEIAPLEEKPLPFIASIRALVGLWPLLILMVACIGPIYAGLATATESAGIGAFASILVGVFVGTLNWKKFIESLKGTVRITSMLFLIILGAMILSKAVSVLGLPRYLVEWVGELGFPSGVLLLGIYIMYVILGCFFDGISMMLMTLPFIHPIIIDLGFDSLWFGVLLVLVMEIGQVTPPLGVNLFVVQGIAGTDTSIGDIFRGTIPFLVGTFIVLAIITFFPEVVSWLPNLLHL